MTGSTGATMPDHDLIEIAARTAFSRHEQRARRPAARLADNWNQRLSDEERSEYRALASAILANVEPLIRNDERDRWLQSDHLDRALRLARADERAEVAREEVQIYARAWDEVSNEVFEKVNDYDAMRARAATTQDALLDLLMAPRQDRLTIWPILYKGAEQDAAAQLLIAAGRLAVVKSGPGWYIVEVVA